MLSVGARSADKDSPAYVPTLFSFSGSPAKCKGERNLQRWESAKRRRTMAPEDDLQEEVAIDTMVVSETHRSLSVQTEQRGQDIDNLISDNQKRAEEIQALKQSNNGGYPSKQELENDTKLLTFYTGFECLTVLMAVFEFVAKDLHHSGHHKLAEFDCFLLTMMKLRLNLNHYDLAFRFGICQTTAGRIFKKWIFLMHSRMGNSLIKWPSRESLQRTTPFCFRVHYGLKVTAIIDCFELFIEKPSNLMAKACTWSQYKHYNTAKYLIAVTPQGVVSFISKGWGGRASDQFITEHSGFLRHVLSGDIILADRGFVIEESLGARGASLSIPAFTKGKDQLTASEIEKTRNIANVRIHVERVIGSVRQRFTILSATGVLPKDYFQQKQDGILLLDAIVRVCCALNNMCVGVVPFD